LLHIDVVVVIGLWSLSCNANVPAVCESADPLTDSLCYYCPTRSLLSMLHFAILAVFHYDFMITILFYHLVCVCV